MKRALLLAVSVAFLAGPALATHVGSGETSRHSGTCWDLYIERNTIFKEAGLCFTRPTAIKTFGNAHCEYDKAEDLPISEADRKRVKRLVAREHALGCPRF